MPTSLLARTSLLLSSLTISASLDAQITSITETAADSYTLDSVTIDGTQYFQNQISVGQLDSVVPASGAAVGYILDYGISAGTTGDKATIDAAASSFIYGTTALNVAAGSIFQFGTTIGDNDKIFILEYGANGFQEINQILELVDINGDVIGSYTHTIDVTSDYTTGLDTWTGNISFRNANSTTGGSAAINSLDGVSISLSDFGVTAGSVTNATGIRYQNSALSDTTMVGLAQIPEPNAYSFLMGAVSLTLLMVRRKCRG